MNQVEECFVVVVALVEGMKQDELWSLSTAIFDSNGTVSTGSQSYGFNNVANNQNALLGVSIAPPTPTSAIKTIDGLAKASVKTVNGLAIASVKTWGGLA